MNLIILSLALLLLATGRSTAAEQPHPAVKVMSFNIRYGAADDGDDRWPNRSDLVAETITLFDPDLLGTQEVLGFQADFLKERLSGYGWHGRGRDADGDGEQAAIFFREDRFELLDSGHFWLSETPEIPGSVSWDSSLTRICTWVKLADKEADNAEIMFFNTHWDHRGAEARLESAKLIRSRVAALDPSIPVIVTGDFNTFEDRAPYRHLVLEGFEGRQLLIDSYRSAHTEQQSDEVTFNGFRGAREGQRIDWVLHSPHWVTLLSEINRINENGRFPSDHYPVEAILRLKPAAGRTPLKLE